MEAGGKLDPGKMVFCSKICSKIIVSQFCIVLANSDQSGAREVPNANVNMEYGLILGHIKYVLPFQNEGQKLPFNVSGLDTIKYTQGNLKQLATAAIEQAIIETSQSTPAPNFDQVVGTFCIAKDTIYVNVQIADQELFELGKSFNFNLLVKFDGISYIFFGNFGAMTSHPILWRLSKLLSLLAARRNAVPVRRETGLATQRQSDAANLFLSKVSAWLVVPGVVEANDVEEWLANNSQDIPVDVYTMTQVNDLVTSLPTSTLTLQRAN